MNTKRLFLTGAAALSITLAPGLQAQDTPSTLGNRDPVLKSPDRDRLTTTTDHSSTVGKVNRASSLIGMDVRNPQNEKLGDIKDVVLDLQSGKIGYVVLSVGGFLGIGEKYIAVPPNAFTVAPDQDMLVLNADKAKIQNAPSFTKNNWPDPHNPTWTTAASYWLSDTAQGTIGTTRTGVGTETALGTSDLDRNRATSPSTLDRSDRPDLRSTDRNTFRGRIIAVNPQTRTMTVEGPSGTREFKFAEKPAITLKDSRNPSLIDLKVGYPVTVGYHEENGQFVAHSVIRTDAPEVK